MIQKILHLAYMTILIFLQWFTFYKQHFKIIIPHEQNRIDTYTTSPDRPIKRVIRKFQSPERNLESLSIPLEQHQMRLPNQSPQKSSQTKNILQLKTVKEIEEDFFNTVPGVNQNQNKKVRSPIKSTRKIQTIANQTNNQICTKSQNTYTDFENTNRNDIEKIGIIGNIQVQINYYEHLFKIISRLLISQSLIGWLLHFEIQFALASLITFSIIFFINYIQYSTIIDQLIETQLCLLFSLTTLNYLQIDLIWTITYLVTIIIQLLYEGVKIYMASRNSISIKITPNQ